MRTLLVLSSLFLFLCGWAPPARAQQPEPTTREGAIEQEQKEKSQHLHPYEVTKAERLMAKAQTILAGGVRGWHPYFENAYSGGGFAFGAGYAQFVSPYTFIDARGSWTIPGYKRAEVEYFAPRLFHRRGTLSVLGGWREATQVAFFGLGSDSNTANRTEFDFQQPYLNTMLKLKPTRRYLTVDGGLQITQWKQGPGQGTAPSVETVYTPTTLPGLGATVDYIHPQVTVGFDWRESPGYSRRGGFLGATFHDYIDRDDLFGFRQIDYEAIQHIPILRETWVLSLHALASTTERKAGQQIPFFMLPTIGSGDTLRGYSSHRFRDRNRLLLQGEWRIMANRFFDSAFFYDAGKVTEHTEDIDFHGLRSDYGFGVRFHGPFATPLRIDIARSNEGLRIVFATSPVF